jgi:NADH-quinone oxidoreductase subunit J
VNQLLFGVIATMGVLAALGTVLAKNLVHAGLFLVAFFFLVACQFVLLEAEFLAAVQVLVYIGAVAIIVMFGIMLTRNIQGDDTTTISKPVFIGSALAATGMLALLIFAIVSDEGTSKRLAWGKANTRPAIYPAASVTEANKPKRDAINNMGKAVGEDLLTRYLIPFEVAGILLTAALVGAIALAVQEGKQTDDPVDRVQKKVADQLASELEAENQLTESRA